MTTPAGRRPPLPEGFASEPEVISPVEEAELVAQLLDLPFRALELHGYG
jgi:hypothetical protein